ncbi:hypothetical protein SAMN05216241_101282 [Limimonas halophila]|uniref:Xaa-Pro dipeptidyl-peptidase C-terminal domain-containing protein n=1 Tax=Limimonas halophila TaxID=1082479 RepID=A0A1G7LK37_9PROT|nr:CocE/NonD family hydrolase [Limimonas halophila]SDF49868.1 hypothetical protein SAMN05216241_101282 [Limimonas halophila]
MANARDIEELSNVWIPMPDGTRLAARIWLPPGARTEPVPAILEYIPYRKADHTAPRDSRMHPYFAAKGYAALRVDLRGSGDSEGLLQDEYLEQELQDGCAILRWLAKQPWCTGKVGMIGISWGGFNGLQIAAKQPPELGAVVSVAFTDDRYSDDVHHMGGCMLVDNLTWAANMFASTSQPPDPATVGESWREQWLDRLRHSGFWLDTWLRHQRRDAYWQHGSVCEDYSAIKAPIYAVSGWADGYSDAVFRLLRNLDAPCKGLVGPWSHTYPHLGEPGPAIGFLQECVRWFDHWLKGVDTGIMAEPRLHMWMKDSVQPATSYECLPGRWIAERDWPAPDIARQRHALTACGLELNPDAQAAETEPTWVRSPLHVGLYAGKWCAYANGPDMPHDQRLEDGGAVVFDGPELELRTEICGAGEVTLDLASDKPVAMVAVRLSDVQPGGEATRITYGLLNLTHRERDDAPEPLEPGQRTRVTVRLHEIAYALPAGHHLRLAISSSYWPLVWPAPEPAKLTIWPGTSTLDLPVRPIKTQDAEGLNPFGPVDMADGDPMTVDAKAEQNWWIVHDLAKDRVRLTVRQKDGPTHLLNQGITYAESNDEHYAFTGNKYDSVRAETWYRRELRRPGWAVTTLTHCVLTSDSEAFELHADIDAYEGEQRIYTHSIHNRIPRDLV